ncbi:uncharacterized protein LOC126705385 isoform X3 [Quercus robur]|uniref:uncharacterized protein LOC126705385 isoform X3 n=1 Tax=Quercus robur TaxID=38942 RepID=UPI0021612944|nr:uncharacterized protein LOC126705385 isoform X3 [Quercus robur]
MSHYKTGKIGLRWRAEKEVISGKGQFICGNKHCDEKDDLASYEVNFSYSEAGENKQALVKLVTCERCADKLHYKRQKEKEQSEKGEREENKRKRNQSRSIDETDNDCEESMERRKSLNIPLVILHFLHDETFLCLYSVHICIYDFILCVKIF